MVTKAELEAELAELKRELAERDAKAASATRESQEETEAPTAASGDQFREALAEALRAHGVDPDELDIDHLWAQLSNELGGLVQERPALTAIAIFALGFILGRISK